MQWIFQRPKLARMAGQAMFSAGGLLIVCGLIGRAGMTALNQARALGKMPPYAGLSEVYPMYPLWWVPEHFIGYAVGVVLAALGAYVALAAKRIRNGNGR